MRALLYIPFLLLLLACGTAQTIPLEPLGRTISLRKDKCSYEVRFSPKGGATDNIVAHIRNTRTSLYATTYSFTSQPITDAIIHLTTHKRPRHIEMILDRSNSWVRGSKLQELIGAGIPVYIDASHAIQHNKVIIIDKRWVITGSFNFSASAESRNAENSIILDCPELAGKYLDNWGVHRLHSIPATAYKR